MYMKPIKFLSIHTLKHSPRVNVIMHFVQGLIWNESYIHTRIQRGRGQGVQTLPSPHPWKITKLQGSLSNTGPDTLENHKATKPAFNVGPSLARQQSISKDGPFLVVFGSSHQLKKIGPPLTKLSGSTQDLTLFNLYILDQSIFNFWGISDIIFITIL